MSQKNPLGYQFYKCLFLIFNYVLINYYAIVFKGHAVSINNHNNCSNLYQSDNFAFSVFLKSNYSKSVDTNTIISQELVIYGIDNYILKQKLLNVIGINHINKKIISRNAIDNLINQMKSSGFFTHIDITKQFKQNHQIIYITVKVNPLLQSIKIINFKNRLITSKYITSLFNKQLGYPINFIEIDKNIDLIQNWYHARGYKWTSVRICNIAHSSGDITINIVEGIINKIEVNNYTVDSLTSLPTSLFLEILKIQPNKILNIKRLEEGILKLKQKKVLAYCNYEIITDNNNQLNIYLSIGLLEDRYTYLFSKNISITSSLFESMDLLLRSSLNHLFYNHNYLEVTIFNIINNIISNEHNIFTNSIYINIFDYDNHALQLFKKQEFVSWPWINEWYLTQLIFVAGDNFGFRHYIRNVGKFHSNYMIDMRFPITGPYLNLRYDQPWIYIYRDILSHITLRLYKDTYTFQKNCIPVLLDQLNDYIFYYKNSILSQTGISLMSKHDLAISTQVIENLTLKQIVSQYLLLHNSPIWHDLKSDIKYSKTNSYYSYFKQLWINNILEFFQLDIKIIFTNLHYIFKNSEAMLECSHFIAKKINQIWYRFPNTLNCATKIRIGIHTQYNIMNNMINIESEVSTLIGRLECLPYSEHFMLIGPDIVRGYIEEVFPFPLKFGKVKLEYHIQFASYHSIFIFLDCAKNMNNMSKLKNHQILFSQYYLSKFNDFNFRLGYGIGVQLKTPFKQIPPLRIEYGYNIHNGKCLHLRLDKQ